MDDEIILNYFQWFDKTTFGYEINNVIKINPDIIDNWDLSSCIFIDINKLESWIIIWNDYINNRNYLSKNKFLSIKEWINHNGACYFHHSRIEEDMPESTKKYLNDENERISNWLFFPIILDNDTLVNIKFIKKGVTKKLKTIFSVEINSNKDLINLLEQIYDSSINNINGYPTILWFEKKIMVWERLIYKYSSNWAMYENISECDKVSSYVTQLCTILRLIDWKTRISEEIYQR